MNQGCTYTETVGSAAGGRTLLAHLAATYPHSSEEEWLGRIERGLVLVDGVPAAPDLVLRRGQRVVWNRPPWEEPEATLVFAVLYLDDDLLAVAKPSGLPTLPGAGYLEHTLLHLVRRRHPEASPLHRLGRGTSGLVLFARSRPAGNAVARAWREGRVEKTYRALVVGQPRSEEFVVETPIGPLPHPLLGAVFGAAPEGKPSLSRARVLERRGGESLVEVRIETGRPHQIRIHMAAAGHPLVGDPLYASGGGFLRSGEALPGDTGYLLHAARLRLGHPATNAPLDLMCRPPRALRTAAEEEGRSPI